METDIEKLFPVTLTRKITDIHSGGFSINEEQALGFTKGDLFETPTELFQLITLHKKNFANNLNTYKIKKLENNPEYKTLTRNVYAHTSVVVDESTVFNTEKGVIVLEEGVTVLPFSYLVGPLRIDDHATINSHSHIGGSYIGKYCKVGGEIANSVFEQYSNKAHAGGMYDAYIGSWVNIGGGTSNSNLKNTYGTIKMGGVETGEQFIGCIIADHAKTAINTSIYTGKIIGVGAHIYSTVTNDVPNFVNYYDKNNMTKIPIDVTAKIATRMMKRRGVQFTEEDKKLLESIYKNNE